MPEVLRDLAERTAHRPEPGGTGIYHYVHTTSRYLHTVHNISRRTRTASIRHLERRQWIAPDGSGRLLVTQSGESIQPTGDYPPGGLSAALFITTTDPAAITGELRNRIPQGSTAKAMKVFREIWNSQVVPPILQRSLLLHLATFPDLSVDTSAQDLTGRPGIAVHHVDQERHRRQSLVFDQNDGALLGADVTALDGANVGLPTPVTTSSTAWLLSGFTATTAPSST